MIRIATVGYLNARPLTAYIDRARFEVIEGYPSEIAELLAEGAVDVALVPVAAALNDGDFRILPGVCVGADGPVGSVLLVSEVPPERWTEVLLDPVSRTSVTLARLLLTQGPLLDKVVPSLVIESCAAGHGVELARGTTACLVIGDEAMDLPDRLVHRVDLAELWKRWTGLPFVFAVWAGRADLPSDVQRHLRAAGELGLRRVAEDYSGDDLRYLTESVRHNLDERALIGLRRYAALAHRAGLVASETVQLFGPIERSLPRNDVQSTLLRAADGHELSVQQALALVDASLTDLMAAADLRRSLLRPGPVYWTPCVEVVVTDIDAFGVGVSPGEGGFLRSPAEVAELAAMGDDVHAAEVLLSGARHPGLSASLWVDAVDRSVDATGAEVWGLSFELLEHLDQISDGSLPDLLQALVDAGLRGVASGNTVVLNDGVRRAIDGVDDVACWRRVARAVSAAGLPWRGGLQIGAAESQLDRIEHLLALREHVVDGTMTSIEVGTVDPRLGLQPVGASAHDLLRTVALARLILPAGCAVSAPWMRAAPSLAQAALTSGADVLCPVILPARGIEADAHYTNPRAVAAQRRVTDAWTVTIDDVRRHLRGVGRDSVRRSSPTLRADAPDAAPHPGV